MQQLAVFVAVLLVIATMRGYRLRGSGTVWGCPLICGNCSQHKYPARWAGLTQRGECYQQGCAREADGSVSTFKVKCVAPEGCQEYGPENLEQPYPDCCPEYVCPIYLSRKPPPKMKHATRTTQTPAYQSTPTSDTYQPTRQFTSTLASSDTRQLTSTSDTRQLTSTSDTHQLTSTLASSDTRQLTSTLASSHTHKLMSTLASSDTHQFTSTLVSSETDKSLSTESPREPRKQRELNETATEPPIILEQQLFALSVPEPLPTTVQPLSMSLKPTLTTIPQVNLTELLSSSSWQQLKSKDMELGNQQGLPSTAPQTLKKEHGLLSNPQASEDKGMTSDVARLGSSNEPIYLEWRYPTAELLPTAEHWNQHQSLSSTAVQESLQTSGNPEPLSTAELESTHRELNIQSQSLASTATQELLQSSSNPGHEPLSTSTVQLESTHELRNQEPTAEQELLQTSGNPGHEPLASTHVDLRNQTQSLASTAEQEPLQTSGHEPLSTSTAQLESTHMEVRYQHQSLPSSSINTASQTVNSNNHELSTSTIVEVLPQHTEHRNQRDSLLQQDEGPQSSSDNRNQPGLLVSPASNFVSTSTRSSVTVAQNDDRNQSVVSSTDLLSTTKQPQNKQATEQLQLSTTTKEEQQLLADLNQLEDVQPRQLSITLPLKRRPRRPRQRRRKLTTRIPSLFDDFVRRW